MDFFVPSVMVQVREYSVKILPTAHKGHQYVVSGRAEEQKWFGAIIYSDIEPAVAWSI